MFGRSAMKDRIIEGLTQDKQMYWAQMQRDKKRVASITSHRDRLLSAVKAYMKAYPHCAMTKKYQAILKENNV